MKKLFLLFVFIAAFLISVIVFFPYGRAYEYAILHFAKPNGVKISYDIKKASILNASFSNISFEFEGNLIKIDSCLLKWKPFKYIFSGNFADVKLTSKNSKAEFFLLKKGDKLIVKGNFPSRIILNVIQNNQLDFLKAFKGKDALYAIIIKDKNGLSIKQLRITGDFEVNARGYIKGGKIGLIGTIKIGKFKREFSF